jgi:hypothetical protein
LLILLFFAKKWVAPDHGKPQQSGMIGKWALSSGMPCRVIPSPSSGTDTDELVECARERRLVIKSRLNRDVDQRLARVGHQFFSVFNAMLS